MKFAKVIRFDKSDLNIFPLIAEEGELALVGTFTFNNLVKDDLKGKIKQSFFNWVCFLNLVPRDLTCHVTRIRLR